MNNNQKSRKFKERLHQLAERSKSLKKEEGGLQKFFKEFKDRTNHYKKEMDKKRDSRPKQSRKRAELVKGPDASKQYKPQYKDGHFQGPQSTHGIISSWDQMIVAKNFPGMYVSPYVAGMNVTSVPTTTLTVARQITECAVYGQTEDFNLGKENYTFLAWCPSMTGFFGRGGPGEIATTDKLGGFVAAQFSSDDEYLPWFCRDSFQSAQASFTMMEVYGTDYNDIGSGAFVWASQADFTLVAPVANWTGEMYVGSMTYGQLKQNEADGVSLNELMRISGDAECRRDFHMRAAVNNNDLLYQSQSHTTSDVPDDVSFAGEIVNFVILVRPYQSITDQQNIPFTLQMGVHCNVAVWPQIQSPASQNMFKQRKVNGQALQVGRNVLSTQPLDPHHRMPRFPHIRAAFDFLKKGIVKHWKPMVHAAASYLPSLLAAQPVKEECIVKENYLIGLQDSHRKLRQLLGQRGILEIEPWILAIEQEIQSVRKTKGRIIRLSRQPDDETQSSDLEVSQLPGDDAKKPPKGKEESKSISPPKSKKK